jgi:hypothetical protein
MKVVGNGYRDQHCDDEPTIVQADRDPGDASEFDLRAQGGSSTESF